MAITKEFMTLLKQELERMIRPVFDKMSTEELESYLNGIGPVLEKDPYIFVRMFKGAPPIGDDLSAVRRN
jgi:hypothetical protein